MKIVGEWATAALLFVIFFSLTIGGCSVDSRKQLIGSWTVSVEKSNFAPPGNSGQSAEIRSMADRLFSKMRLTVADDQTYVVGVLGKVEKGKWEIHDRTVVFHPDPPQKQKDNQAKISEDGSTLTFSPASGSSLVFVRSPGQ